MLVNVTEKDIQKGIIDPCKCPVARAIKRQFGVADVTVSPGWVKIGDEYSDVPPEVAHFIQLFDMGFPFRDTVAHPFTFNLETTHADRSDSGRH